MQTGTSAICLPRILSRRALSGSSRSISLLSVNSDGTGICYRNPSYPILPASITIACNPIGPFVLSGSISLIRLYLTVYSTTIIRSKPFSRSPAAGKIIYGRSESSRQVNKRKKWEGNRERERECVYVCVFIKSLSIVLSVSEALSSWRIYLDSDADTVFRSHGMTRHRYDWCTLIFAQNRWKIFQ